MTWDGGTRLGVDFGTSNTVAVMVGPADRVWPILPSAVSAGSSSPSIVPASAWDSTSDDNRGSR